MREYDIIIYGATGYTARYIVDRFKDVDIRIALAARDIECLKETRYSKYKCEIDELHGILPRARVLINCAGPFVYTGESIIEMCLNAGTHYMDISREPYFLEVVINKYHDVSLEKGLFIINCCGFMSVIADVGIMYLKSYFDYVQAEGAISVENFLLNTTGFETVLAIAQNLENTNNLIERRYGKLKNRRTQRLGLNSNSYQVLSRDSDFAVLMRTWELMALAGIGDASYVSYIEVGTWMNLVRYYATFMIIMVLCNFRVGRWLLKKLSHLVGRGTVKENPPVDEIGKVRFKVEIKSIGEKNGRILRKRLTISGPDPTYITTSVCVVETTILFLKYLDEMNHGTMFKGGVVTPGCILYDTDIIHRLMSKGIRFEVVDE